MSRAVPALVGALVVSALLLIALTFFGPTVGEFSDTGPLTPSEPPTARNACEREFADLTDGLGIPATPIPSPVLSDVVKVMDACTATELFAANRRFGFAVGGPMTALVHRVFFNGPDPGGQLRRLCASRPEVSATKACSTRGAAS